MSYTKNIAVIKGLRDGFSADGGALSGLVKAEKYSQNLKVEVKLINFAPLTEGRYVAAISDGKHVEIVENCLFEGQSALEAANGFAAVVCYVNGSVQLLASAVCGNYDSAVFGLKGEIERAEKIKPDSGKSVVDANQAAAKIEETEKAKIEVEGKETSHSSEVQIAPAGYEDEAIAEVNYYEFGKTDENCDPVCENPQKEEDGRKLYPNETCAGAVEKGEGGLARGGFYDKMKAEAEGLMLNYPHCKELEGAIEGSEWVKICYGGDKYYVFGILFAAGVPRYLCYGVPSFNAADPPESMRQYASFLPVETEKGSGFWIMYQDADTGASVKISNQ